MRKRKRRRREVNKTGEKREERMSNGWKKEEKKGRKNGWRGRGWGERGLAIMTIIMIMGKGLCY